LGFILTQRFKYLEAVSILSGVPEAIGAKIGANSYDAIVATGRLGRAFMSVEKYEEAEKYIRASMEKWTNQYGAHIPSALDSMAKLGRVLGKLGRYNEAMEMLTKAVAARKETLPPGHPIVRQIEHDILEIQLAKGETPLEHDLDMHTPLLEESAIDPIFFIPYNTSHLAQDPRAGRADSSSQSLLSMSRGRRVEP
jgi:tetratricopeptide (TPR) repeat protein